MLQLKRHTMSRLRNLVCSKFFFRIGCSVLPLYLAWPMLANISFCGLVSLAGSYEQSYGGCLCMILLPVTSLTTFS
jgi:hypothetical protein